MTEHEKKHNQFIEEIKKGKKVGRARAVRMFCLACCGFAQNETIDCGGHNNCALFPFRLGSSLHGKKLLNEIERGKKLFDNQ